jgi:hypothetical protein
LSSEKPETWDAVLASHSADVQAAARTVIGVILEEAPGAVVTFDRGDGLLAIGWGSGRRDFLFALIPHAGWLNVQLADGALLPDPTGIVEGTGKRIRHVKVRSGEAATRPDLREVVRAQVRARVTGSP